MTTPHDPISTVREALEAMLACQPMANDGFTGEKLVTERDIEACRKARAALAALSAQTANQEPVMWRRAARRGWEYRTSAPTQHTRGEGWMPLYAESSAPSQAAAQPVWTAEMLEQVKVDAAMIRSKIMPAPMADPPEEPDLRINPTHEAADAFWKHWEENGEFHKHGYYESTWGAINAALKVAGLRSPDVAAPVSPSSPLPDETAERAALQYVVGCFDAAFVEGLTEALAETQDERLKDLIGRRLMYAYQNASAVLTTEEAPAAPVSDEREAFEKEFSQHDLTIKNGAYTFRYVQHAWEGWQARGRQLSAPPAQAIPAELIEIGKLIATQDNRYTDQPMFLVERKRRITGIDPDYATNIVWLCPDDDYREADKDEQEKLDAQYRDTCEIPDGWVRTGYADEWEFVTACFTEQGCKDYLAINGHNIKGEARIYADGSFRNNEFRLIRNWLLSLAASPSAPKETGE